MYGVALPDAGYTCREAAKILGVSSKYIYKLFSEKRAVGYVDCVGQMRITKEETYRLMHELEK